jgi:hypothetical protein
MESANDILKLVNALIVESLPEINTAIDNEFNPDVAGTKTFNGEVND